MFNFLHGLAEKLQGDLSPGNMHRYIVEGVAEVVGAEAGILYLLDAETNRLVPAFQSAATAPVLPLPPEIASVSDRQEAESQYRSYIRLSPVSPGETFIGRVLREGGLFCVPDLAAQPGFESGAGELRLHEGVRVLATPLVYARRALGILVVTRRGGGNSPATTARSSRASPSRAPSPSAAPSSTRRPRKSAASSASSTRRARSSASSCPGRPRSFPTTRSPRNTRPPAMSAATIMTMSGSTTTATASPSATSAARASPPPSSWRCAVRISAAAPRRTFPGLGPPLGEPLDFSRHPRGHVREPPLPHPRARFARGDDGPRRSRTARDLPKATGRPSSSRPRASPRGSTRAGLQALGEGLPLPDGVGRHPPSLYRRGHRVREPPEATSSGSSGSAPSSSRTTSAPPRKSSIP